MRQLEHERGGIDRLVSNYALYQLALEPGRPRRPGRAPGDRRARDRLPHRAAPGDPRGARARRPSGFSAATKCFGTEHEIRVAEFVARTLGAQATLWDPVTQGLIYAPGYTIMGGTSNVMRNILGERVLGLPRA